MIGSLLNPSSHPIGSSFCSLLTKSLTASINSAGNLFQCKTSAWQKQFSQCLPEAFLHFRTLPDNMPPSLYTPGGVCLLLISITVDCLSACEPLRDHSVGLIIHFSTKEFLPLEQHRICYSQLLHFAESVFNLDLVFCHSGSPPSLKSDNTQAIPSPRSLVKMLSCIRAQAGPCRIPVSSFFHFDS